MFPKTLTFQMLPHSAALISLTACMESSWGFSSSSVVVMNAPPS